MATLIITEKASQARDLRAALGVRFGQILPAEGHLLRLAEPEEVNPAWKNWSCVVLKPDGLYPTRPAAQGNKPAKLKAIAAALRTCDEVILATDCDREGQLIGQEILDHLGYRGRVRRALFTAQDPKTLQQAFARLKPNVELRPLYEAAGRMPRPRRADGRRILDADELVASFRRLPRDLPGGASPRQDDDSDPWGTVRA